MRISKSEPFSDDIVGSRPSWAVYETLSPNTKAKVNFPNGGGKNNLPGSARCPPLRGMGSYPEKMEQEAGGKETGFQRWQGGGGGECSVFCSAIDPDCKGSNCSNGTIQKMKGYKVLLVHASDL